MSESFKGSVEIVNHAGENRGVPGVNWTPEAVPAVVAAVAGITDLTAVEPEPVASGRVPEAQWTGEYPAGFAVTVRLWRELLEDTHPPLADQSPVEEGGD